MSILVSHFEEIIKYSAVNHSNNMKLPSKNTGRLWLAYTELQGDFNM